MELFKHDVVSAWCEVFTKDYCRTCLMCIDSLKKTQPQTKQAWGFLVGFLFYHQTEGLKE